jgi:hypothetical protein
MLTIISTLNWQIFVEFGKGDTHVSKAAQQLSVSWKIARTIGQRYPADSFVFTYLLLMVIPKNEHPVYADMLWKAECTYIFAKYDEVAGPWRQRSPLLDADDTARSHSWTLCHLVRRKKPSGSHADASTADAVPNRTARHYSTQFCTHTPTYHIYDVFNKSQVFIAAPVLVQVSDKSC